jgi:hypothetical protein
MRIASQPIGQTVDTSTVVSYQLFPSRRRPGLIRLRGRARGRRGLPSLRIRGGPLRHRFDLPTVSGTTEQVQPERLIVACHPGNALSEPWQLAVPDRVLPHNFPNAVRSERVPSPPILLCSRGAKEAGAVVPLRETKSMLRSSFLRPPAGAHRRSHSSFAPLARRHGSRCRRPSSRNEKHVDFPSFA